MKHQLITLGTPIRRGETTIADVALSNPNVRHLRGLSAASLAQLDVDQVAQLITRISAPSLTVDEVMEMESADFMKLGAAILGFLLPAVTQDLQFLNS